MQPITQEDDHNDHQEHKRMIRTTTMAKRHNQEHKRRIRAMAKRSATKNIRK
jgi:hypothetical protein